jgi:zinc protease
MKSNSSCCFRSVLFAVLPFLLFALFVQPLSAQTFFKDRVQEAVLPNGLKVIMLEMEKAPVVTFQVWYRVGSRNESWGKTGLAHLLEHMMFKGTKTTGPEQFSRIIQENGGNDNAFTSHDYTGYFTNISADRVDIPLALEADRMANLLIREEDFVTERMVVIEERRLRTEDNPQAYLGEQLEAAAFQVQPYHWPIIGWMDDLKALTLTDAKAYYKRFYTPANAFIVVVGAFKKAKLLPLIEKAFGGIPKGKALERRSFSEQPQAGERRVIVKKEANQPAIVMGYHVPKAPDPDSYILEVVEALLSSGKSSRLYRNLVRGKRICLSADASNSFLSVDPDLFYLSAEPLPGISIEEVEKALDDEVRKLQTERVEAKELERVINSMEASFIYGQDSLFSQAMLLARYEITAGWQAADHYLPLVRRVTPDEIRRVAAKYLQPDNRTVGILIPLPPKEGQEPGAEGKAGHR